MDVQEVRKLDAYLKHVYGNARLRVVPAAKKDTADVFAGDERIGGITVDDEDDERSYNFEIKILLGEAADLKNLKMLEAYLRRKFDNERVRVVGRPRKKDSPRSMSAMNILACCSSTRRTAARVISRWRSWRWTWMICS